MITKGLMSSDTNDWETPQKLYDYYHDRFCFDLDVCASTKNTKHSVNYFTIKDNGLKQDWYKINWMNPPYGRQIGLWVKKAYDESLKGKVTVCLLPARTDTKWWHDYVLKADHIHFIKGRLKFSGQKNSAPFPSCIVIFGLNYRR